MPAALQQRVLGGVAVQAERVGMALAEGVDVRLVGVDHHERAVGDRELVRDVGADAPDAAHDVVARTASRCASACCLLRSASVDLAFDMNAVASRSM